MGTHDRLLAEIPDIFIPPTPIGNAGVLRGRNENSGMTTGDGRGRGLFHKHGLPVKQSPPTTN